MKKAFNLETLTAMSADELEQYRDRGREYRVMLNCAVLGQLALPEGWQVVAWLYLDEHYTPATVNRVLHTVAGYYRLGLWRPEKLAVALRMGGHCL